MKYNIIIGIDPGTQTGLAVWNTGDQAFELIATLPLWCALNRVTGIADATLYLKEKVLVVVEDARTWKPFRGTSRAASDARLKGAGSIRRDCAIWEEFLKDKGYPYKFVSLRSAKKKMNAATFKRVTDWDQKTTEHGRDAGCLVFGMK